MFFVGKKPRLNNTHFIHRNNCDLLPLEKHRISLKEAIHIESALLEANKHFETVKPCPVCNPEYNDGSTMEAKPDPFSNKKVL